MREIPLWVSPSVSAPKKLVPRMSTAKPANALRGISMR